jgi:hypothetical protein
LPHWGVDHALSLDVARIRVRVNLEEDELRAKKTEREKLSIDVVELDKVFEANECEASKIRSDAEALLKATKEGRSVEDQRKEDMKKAVHEADCECKEVESLLQSIEDLSATQEENAKELKQLVDKKDNNLSDLQKNIESTLAELKSFESRTKAAQSHQKAKQAQFAKELQNAKETKHIIEKAFRLAQERAEDFAVQPDDELIAEMKQLDDDENAIKTDADRERNDIISSTCFIDLPQHFVIVLNCFGLYTPAQRSRSSRTFSMTMNLLSPSMIRQKGVCPFSVSTVSSSSKKHKLNAKFESIERKTNISLV